MIFFLWNKWDKTEEESYEFCFLYKNLLLLESWLYLWKCLLLMLLAFCSFFLLTFFTVTPTILKTQDKITHQRIFPKHLTPNTETHVFSIVKCNRKQASGQYLLMTHLPTNVLQFLTRFLLNAKELDNLVNIYPTNSLIHIVLLSALKPDSVYKTANRSQCQTNWSLIHRVNFIIKSFMNTGDQSSFYKTSHLSQEQMKRQQCSNASVMKLGKLYRSFDALVQKSSIVINWLTLSRTILWALRMKDQWYLHIYDSFKG